LNGKKIVALGAALILWLIELSISRRQVQVPSFLLFVIGALLAIGFWMVVNAGAIMDTAFGVFVPLQKLVPHAPGSVDYAISADAMIRAALLLGTILFVADLSRDNPWFLQLSQTIGIVAGSIAKTWTDLTSATADATGYFEYEVGSPGVRRLYRLSVQLVSWAGELVTPQPNDLENVRRPRKVLRPAENHLLSSALREKASQLFCHSFCLARN